MLRGQLIHRVNEQTRRIAKTKSIKWKKKRHTAEHRTHRYWMNDMRFRYILYALFYPMCSISLFYATKFVASLFLLALFFFFLSIWAILFIVCCLHYYYILLILSLFGGAGATACQVRHWLGVTSNASMVASLLSCTLTLCCCCFAHFKNWTIFYSVTLVRVQTEVHVRFLLSVRICHRRPMCP